MIAGWLQGLKLGLKLELGLFHCLNVELRH